MALYPRVFVRVAYQIEDEKPSSGYLLNDFDYKISI